MISITFARSAASDGARSPAPTAATIVAAATTVSVARSRGGSSKAIESFLRAGASRSMQMRMAAISPALAMSTALRAMASASSSNRFWNRIVARLRDPRGRLAFLKQHAWLSFRSHPAKKRRFTRLKIAPAQQKTRRGVPPGRGA